MNNKLTYYISSINYYAGYPTISKKKRTQHPLLYKKVIVDATPLNLSFLPLPTDIINLITNEVYKQRYDDVITELSRNMHYFKFKYSLNIINKFKRFTDEYVQYGMLNGIRKVPHHQENYHLIYHCITYENKLNDRYLLKCIYHSTKFIKLDKGVFLETSKGIYYNNITQKKCYSTIRDIPRRITLTKTLSEEIYRRLYDSKTIDIYLDSCNIKEGWRVIRY